MKNRIAMVVAGMALGIIASDTARAESRWSLEFGSPIWTCLIRCSAPQLGDDPASCLEACGTEHDAEPPSAEESAGQLRCQASLMRTEAAQLSCHARCLAESDSAGEDRTACMGSCDSRYDSKAALILATARCAALRNQ